MCETDHGPNGAALPPPPNRNSATMPYGQVQDYISQVGNYKYVYLAIF